MVWFPAMGTGEHCDAIFTTYHTTKSPPLAMGKRRAFHFCAKESKSESELVQNDDYLCNSSSK